MKMKEEVVKAVLALHTKKIWKMEIKVREEGSRLAWVILTQYIRSGRIY